MTSRAPETKGRSEVAAPTDPVRSNAEQIDRAENEGMTFRPQKASTRTDSERHPAETTNLERRVLAHQRILQSLIAHMTETDPRFLERLQQTYNIQIKYREQDYTDTGDFAEEFVHAIEDAVLLQKTKSDARYRKPTPEPSEMVRAEPATTKPARFQIKNRNGVWEVKENGRFYGDYFLEEDALEAVRKAIKPAND